ncbi:hypothetical protein MASR1M90_11920 [Desulfovibrionales bacterium]
MHKKTNKLYCKLYIFLFLLAACQPVHVTRQYYDEYINPKASIDYDFTYNLNLPEEYMNAYFDVDSSLSRLKDELNYIEYPNQEMLVNTNILSQSWIKEIAFYDDMFFFIAGSQALSMNERLKDFLQTQAQRTEKSFMVMMNDTCFFINTLKIGNDLFRTAVVEIDIEELLKNSNLPDFALSIDKTIVHGTQDNTMVDLVYEKAMRDKSLSGKARYENQSRQWVRSLAADNLIYIFAG